MTPVERRKIKAVKRSRLALPKKKVRTEKSRLRLERYVAKCKRMEIINRQFSL